MSFAGLEIGLDEFLPNDSNNAEVKSKYEGSKLLGNVKTNPFCFSNSKTRHNEMDIGHYTSMKSKEDEEEDTK